MTTTADLLAAGKRFFVPIYKPRETILERGLGARVWDRDGKEYVDFGAGIAVCGLGHCDPDLVKALTEQAGKLWHTSNVFYSEPPLRLAEELVEASRFAERVFLCNSGAEANEAAIKLARKWAAAQGRPPEKRVIVTFRGSFHGRTLAAVTATAQPKYQEGYEPLPGGFRYLDFNDLAQAEAAFSAGDVAAVLVEPIQGEGGVMPAAPGFLRSLHALCDKHDALLLLDEIQCGMGRTGQLFAHWHDGIKPDIVTLAKALGGGFPIGAVLATAEAASGMTPGSHGSTFGGNPLAIASANAVLDVMLKPGFFDHVQKMSLLLKQKLASVVDRYPAVLSEVRGEGLLVGVKAVVPSGDLVNALRDQKLLTVGAGDNVVRFLAPLIVTEAEIDESIEMLERACVALSGNQLKKAAG